MLCNIYTPGDKKNYEWRLFISPVKVARYLGLDEMTDPYFSHDRNGNCLDDLFDHLRVTLEKGQVRGNGVKI
jgi:hypothetical protein